MFDRFRGVLPKSVGEGTHFLVPFIQNPTIYDIRTRPKSITSVTGTKDLQQVNLTLRVLHRPDVARLPEIHTNLGPEYEERVLPSIGNEVLKATVAQFNADQLLTMRDEVSKRVSFALRKRAEDFGIVLEDVALTHLSFGVEYSRAIEAKVWLTSRWLVSSTPTCHDVCTTCQLRVGVRVRVRVRVRVKV